MALRIDSGINAVPDPIIPKPYIPPPNTTFARPPTQVVAEVGDDFPKLADRLGVETSDLVNANPDISRISAGAVFNVPQPAPVYDVPRFDPAGGQTYQEWLDVQAGASQPAQQDKLNIFKDIFYAGGGSPGRLPGETISDFLKPIRDFFFPNDETSYLPPGVGTGAGIGIPTGTSTAVPQDTSSAEYADFRQAEALAAYTDREAGFMTGFQQPAPPVPPAVDARIRAEALYEAQYGVSSELSDASIERLLQIEANEVVRKSFIPDPDRPFEMPPHPSENPEIFANIRASGGDAQAAYNEAVQKWDDAIMAHYEEGSGYGGGIPGWIEEKTGLVGIDPWNMTDEEFEIFLAAFDTEELNYLESHGILVPEDVYVGGGTPVYGSGGIGKAGGRQPVGYGGFSSQRPSYANRESYLGLTSWSI